jgi:hypothetical protein
MRYVRLYPAASLLLIGTQTVTAQQLRTIDLSSAAAHDTVHVSPGRYRFRVVNLSPKYSYTIAISQGAESIAPIPAAFAQGDVSCPKLTAALKSLAEARQEEDVPPLAQAVRDALSAEGKKDKCAEASADAARLLARTERVFDDVFDLGAGDYVLVVVGRLENEKTTRRWERRFTTGAPGEWRTTYGYVFPAFTRLSHGTAIREGQRYFSRQIGDTGSRFVVTEERHTRQFDAVPAAMFSYAPASERAYTWNMGAGLGVDLAKPVVLLGLGVTYYSNLRITAGAAFRQESVLLGQYTPGDTIRSNLTREQLQGDEFRVRPFIGVTLRFDGNPFKKPADAGAAGQKAGEKQAAKAGDQPSGAGAP